MKPGALRLILTWSAYLASSWTWCIGMYLPALLARDYGLGSFAIFAAPNVIGAAAMAWTLRSGGSASAIRAAHASMIQAFSCVTIAFHAFFLAWISDELLPISMLGPGATSTLLCAAALILGAVIGTRTGKPGLSWIILAVSACAAFFLLTSPARPSFSPPPPDAAHSLAMIAPVCLFGFALCPYLDTTFIHAREELADGPARSAFAIGFALLFLPAVGLTLLYGVALLPHAAAGTLTRTAGIAVLAHIAAQCGYTMALHASLLRLHRRGTDDPSRASMVWLALSLAAGLLAGPAATRFGVERELVYRLFMAAYALAFPSYVLICMMPSRGAVPTARQVTAWAVACAGASPFFWIGLIERREIWLAPGLALIALTPLVLRAFVPAPAPRSS